MSDNNPASALLNSVINGEELTTEFKVCPEVEANATITKYSIRSGTSDKAVRDNNPEGIWASLSFSWNVDSEEAREEMERDEVIVRQDLFLSIKNGGIDPNGNQSLAKLAEILGVEAEGEQTFQEYLDSFIGQVGFVRVAHETYEKDGESMVTAKVVSVAEPE